MIPIKLPEQLRHGRSILVTELPKRVILLAWVEGAPWQERGRTYVRVRPILGARTCALLYATTISGVYTIGTGELFGARYSVQELSVDEMRAAVARATAQREGKR